MKKKTTTTDFEKSLTWLERTYKLKRKDFNSYNDFFSALCKAVQKEQNEIKKMCKEQIKMCNSLTPIKKNTTLPVIGANDSEISYDELVSLAFDTNTPEHLSTHYQAVLINAQQTVKELDIDWYRIIFVKHLITGKIRTWLDKNLKHNNVKQQHSNKRTN